ncbi:RNA polymerase sigma factor [Azospirillum sp. ST 5-10]|uniref:RNA polymerase sigma factor n=1 Tax=unclassified Azospirillum TaxID=2630922 RepID=UPI003F49B5C2
MLLLQAYSEHERELVRFLARRLGSSTLAADIAHDLYLKLCNVKDHQDIRDRKAYLFKLAANLATDHVRAERRRQEILAEADGLVWRQSEELTPERYMAARMELRLMEEVIAALPERCRQVFHLCRYEGRSQAEAAAELGISVTTAYTDLKVVMDALLKARRKFRASRGPGDA